MKNAILLALIFFLLGCSSANHFQFEPYLPKTQHAELMLPAWLTNFPDSPDYVLGVSYLENDRLKMEGAAKEFAAVQINRNKNSIIISKHARSYSDQAQFEVNVSSSIDSLKNCYEELDMIENVVINNYFLALFKLKSAINIHYDKKLISNQTVSKPDWFSENHIIENEHIFSFSQSSSENLIFAFEKAFEICRIQIADYLEKNIKSILTNRGKYNEKYVAIETDMLLSNLIISNIFISSKTYDSLSAYTVYVKMHYSEK
ncbi:MAG: hypothetical protein K8S23_14200 [Candidatus Cloacimonetes bacterium]|nr:hypothetical protein [Candidatus Cloacimonadota bacterium]